MKKYALASVTGCFGSYQLFCGPDRPDVRPGEQVLEIVPMAPSKACLAEIEATLGSDSPIVVPLLPLGLWNDFIEACDPASEDEREAQRMSNWLEDEMDRHRDGYYAIPASIPEKTLSPLS